MGCVAELLALIGNKMEMTFSHALLRDLHTSGPRGIVGTLRHPRHHFTPQADPLSPFDLWPSWEPYCHSTVPIKPSSFSGLKSLEACTDSASLSHSWPLFRPKSLCLRHAHPDTVSLNGPPLAKFPYILHGPHPGKVAYR